MVLVGSYVTLRAIEERDLDLLRELINDLEIQRLTLGWSYPISEYDQKQWFYNLNKNNDCIRWIIVNSNDQAVGMCMLNNINWRNRTANIGIKLDNSNKTKGIGTESYNLMTKYAFEELNVNRLEAEIIEYNKASIGLHKKVGFKEEGRRRESVFQKGRYYDTLIFSLIYKDFIKGRFIC